MSHLLLWNIYLPAGMWRLGLEGVVAGEEGGRFLSL